MGRLGKSRFYRVKSLPNLGLEVGQVGQRLGRMAHPLPNLGLEVGQEIIGR